MKSISLLPLVSFMLLSLSVIAENNKPQGIYFRESADGVVKIPAHSFTGRRTASEFSWLYDDVKSYGLTIYQPSSEIAITDHSPEFLIILNPTGNAGGPEYKSDWVFSSATGPSDFLLCKLSQTKESRVLKIGKSYEDFLTTVGPECLSHETLDINMISDNTYIVKPVSELKNGQYAFVYIGGFVNDKIPPYIVFDFSIVDYTAETLEKIKPGMLYSEVAEIMHFQPKKKKKSGDRMEWNFPGAGKVYFRRGAVVEVVPEKN